MGEMADYAINETCEMEALRDDYVNGDMSVEDAYDNGLINELGGEKAGIKEAWDRAYIPTEESLNNDIEKQSAFLNNRVDSENNFSIIKNVANKFRHISSKNLDHLNDLAVVNLTKDRPTCNYCELIMKRRSGKFGDFFYCSCAGQKTISIAYWESIRIRIEL